MNWFQRHLNWTYGLANLFVLGILLAAQAEVVGGVASLAGLAILPVSGWVIIQKGRSLWWILLSGLLSPLWLPNKKAKPEPLNSSGNKAGRMLGIKSLICNRWNLLLLCLIFAAVLSLIGLGVYSFFNYNDYQTTYSNKTATVTRVIDGDTIEIEGGFRIRYIGIDTPEKGDYYFEEATLKNAELVLGKEVRLEKDVSETDKYGRLLRYVNAELVRLGYAREAYYPPDTKYNDIFLRLEKYAAASDLELHNEPINIPSASSQKTNPFRQESTYKSINPFR